MPHLNDTQRMEGMASQLEAMRELRDHAHRLIGGLAWITDDVAELVASLNQLAEG